MKKIWSVALCLALLVGMISYAPTETAAKALTTGKCGSGVTYSFDSETGTLTISGRGSMTDFKPNGNTSPFCGNENILSVRIEDGVTSVGQWAFYNCFGLQSAELGKDVKTVCEWAFYGCVGLGNLTMQPGSVTRIEDGAFMHCKAMKEINVPDSLSYIGAQAFDDTGYYQTESNWKDNVLYIGSCLYSGVYNYVYTDPRYQSEKLPYGGGSGGAVSTKPSRIASGNYTIKEGTTFLAVGALKSSALTGVTIPKSIHEISSSAFAHSSLTSITIPGSVRAIGSQAFYYCGKLEKVTIPKSVAEIGEGAFKYCKALERITIPSGVMIIGDNAFERSALKSIKLPKTVKSIGNEAFYYCGSLKKATLNNGLRAVGEAAFERCALKSITVPKSVTIIGKHAFGYNGSNKSDRIKGFQVKGYKGSAAQKYAKDNKLKFVTIKK